MENPSCYCFVFDPNDWNNPCDIYKAGGTKTDSLGGSWTYYHVCDKKAPALNVGKTVQTTIYVNLISP